MNDRASRLVDMNSAADYLGVHRSSIRRMIEDGRLPFVPVGSRRMLDRRDLDAYIEQNKAVVEVAQ